jgi:hypothetical protein
MKQAKLFLRNISDFLGPNDDRYFSSGFRNMDISYHQVQCNSGQLTANIQVQMKSDWSKKNGHCLVPHLGTTEFISIAAVASQLLMENELKMNQDDIERSWINRFTCKIRQYEDIDCDCIPLSAQILLVHDTGERVVYHFRVQTGSLPITMEVCCLRNSAGKDRMVKSGEVDLYRTGYKWRSHFITSVIIDGNEMKASGKVCLLDENKERKGIGAGYSGMMLTDFILITGQLTQSLLYHLNHINREESHNMWLREIDVRCENPANEMICDSEIHFFDIHQLHKKEEVWQLVGLSGTLGNMHSKIKVAQRLI